jgi:hypothetical protein
MDQLQQNIKGVLVEDAATQAESYSTELEDLQKQLIKSVNEGKSYDDFADKIRSVKEKRDRALDIEATENEHEKQIREIQKFLDTHDRNVLEYDDSLVRKLIKVITVHRHSLEFEFKSGTKVEIEI